ncbi:MAG TPA: copper resistance protein CopC [Symbiobacteriaceae bacterium]|nr:copper resistance protein CopC [Symbiobacteriaceae bacterium]
MNRLLIALAVLLAALTVPAAASAHATLVQSFPTHGQNLDNAPPSMEIIFNEAVSAPFNPLTVRNSRGERVDQGDAIVDPGDPVRVEVNLKPLPPGLYTAVYRVASLDGHPVEGAIVFSVGAAGEAPAIDQAAPPTVATPPAVGVVHGLAQLVACLLAGLAAFLVLVAGGESMAHLGRLALALVLLLAGLGFAEMSLYAVRASGEAWSPQLLGRALLATRVGNIWLWRLGLAAAAGGALALVSRLKWAAPIAGLGLLFTFSLQSHAMALGRTLPVVVDYLHLVALAPWVGGLAGFALAPRAELVPRFSRVALVSVALLAGTGTYGALQHMPSWQALWTTVYGRALLWKLGLLVPVLALAAYNLFRRGQGRFRLSVRGELVLVMGIFLAAGFLTSLPPAGVELALKQGPFEETATADGFTIGLKITPNRLGFNQATITLLNPEGKPEPGANAGLRLTMLEHDMGTQSIDAREISPGTYGVRDVILGMPGEWQVEVAALTKGGREVRYAFRVKIPSPP